MKKILAALLLAILVLSAVPCLAESVPTIRITIVMNPLVTDYEDNYLSTPYDCNRFSLVTDDDRRIVSQEMLRLIQGKI